MQREALFALLAISCGAATPLDEPHLRAHPDVIDLGYADCGGATPSADWVVENDGIAPLEVLATADPRLSLDRAHFFVGARGATTVHVSGLGAAKDEHAGNVTHASIHVTTNDGAQPFDIDVTATTRGAALAFVPTTINLGLVPISITSPPHGFALANTGNSNIDVGLSQPNPAFTIALDSLHVAADQTVQGTATFLASIVGAANTTVAIDATGVLCGDAPHLEVHANGSEGVFGASPGSINFGSVICGHAAKPQTITLMNAGSSPYAFTAALASGTGFHVAPSSGVVVKSLALTVTPLPMPQNATPGKDLYGDSLTITTNIPNDAPHVVPIQELARGALLRFASPTDSFGKVEVGEDATRVETVYNDGTPENLFFGAVTSGDFTIAASTYPTYGGGADVTFHPQPTRLGETESAHLTLDVSGDLCGAPPSIDVDATSHDVAFSVVALDDATCVDAGETYPVHVYCWGRNDAGQFGTTNVSGSLTPYLAYQFTNIARGMGGGGTFVFSGISGTLTDWGTVNGVFSAPATSTPSQAYYASASADVACLVDTFFYCMGKGGDLGDGTTNDSTSPVFIYMQAVGNVATGFDGHTCGATTNGVACWGPNDWGQVGNGSTSTQNVLSPQIVANTDSSYTEVAAGDGFSCAQSPSTDVLCWGRNTSGECGAAPSSSPMLVPNAIPVGAYAFLTAGRTFACAQPLSPSTIMCWGSNNRGQLGDGGNEQTSSIPVTVGLAGKPGYIVRAGG